MRMSDKTKIQNVVRIILTDRVGRVVAERTGHNIWTNTGREFTNQHQCYVDPTVAPRVPVREDRLLYMGVGSGYSPEVVGVTRLVTPVEYVVGEFLKPFTEATQYPVGSSYVSTLHTCSFDYLEVSFGGAVQISEVGIFSDGDPASSWVPGTRETGIATADVQAPMGYHSFDPIPKTSAFRLTVMWEIRL